jgi:hypothetical protein
MALLGAGPPINPFWVLVLSTSQITFARHNWERRTSPFAVSDQHLNPANNKTTCIEDNSCCSAPFHHWRPSSLPPPLSQQYRHSNHRVPNMNLNKNEIKDRLSIGVTSQGQNHGSGTASPANGKKSGITVFSGGMLFQPPLRGLLGGEKCPVSRLTVLSRHRSKQSRQRLQQNRRGEGVSAQLRDSHQRQRGLLVGAHTGHWRTQRG